MGPRDGDSTISQPPACSQAPAPPPPLPAASRLLRGPGPDPAPPPPHWGPESPAMLASAPLLPSYSAHGVPSARSTRLLPQVRGRAHPGRNDSPGPCLSCCPISAWQSGNRLAAHRRQEGPRGSCAPSWAPGQGEQASCPAQMAPCRRQVLFFLEPINLPYPPLTGLRGHACAQGHTHPSPPEDFIPLSADPEIKRQSLSLSLPGRRKRLTRCRVPPSSPHSTDAGGG